MENKANIPLVDAVRAETVQTYGKKKTDTSPGGSLAWFFVASDILPAWWSVRRDKALDEFWRSVNLISGAMYAMVSKMTTIPFHIEPKDKAITSHFRDAERYEQRLYESSEFGKGWGEFFSKQVLSLLGQDNGRFMEIIDLSGDKSGPLLGPAIGVSHLDPMRCTRTSNWKYPVNYRDAEGNIHQLHWTRVAFQAQLPSIRDEMLGVGFCAISRATSYAQNMLDISQYKEEKLGSRPMRGILLAKGGLDADSVGDALQVAEGMTAARGLKRYSMLPIVGNPEIEEPGLELISLSSLPDNFTEKDATDIAMAAISLAFGVDARELWPNLQANATRADALLQHIKQRGKGPGHIIIETERMINNWFLPSTLRMVFDYQDDAQDRQRAEISKERSIKRKYDIEIGVTNDRIERQHMTTEGELTSAQYEDLELDAGRLPDGTPLETVFYRQDEIYRNVLTIPGVNDPLDILSNDPYIVLQGISAQIPIALEILATETRQIEMRRAKQAYYALLNLQRKYEELIGIAAQTKQPPKASPSENRQGVREGAPKDEEDESPMDIIPLDENNLADENSPRDLKK